MDHELDDPLVGDAATMKFNKTRDRVLDLKQLLAAAVFHRQVEEQVAVLDIGLPSALTLARPCPREHDAPPMQPLVQTFADFREELAVGVVTDVGEAPMDREMRHQS